MYYIGYVWNEEAHKLTWDVHDGVKYLKRGFKTRKAARVWCDNNGIIYYS